MGAFAIAASVALADLRREPLALACNALALAAVMAPLLILQGLKVGLLEIQIGALARDTSAREISVQGVGDWPQDLLQTLRADPSIGFVVPHPRHIHADRVFISSARSGAPSLEQSWFMATAADDPLRPPGAPPPVGAQAVISDTLAARLSVSRGDAIALIAERAQGTEAHRIVLTVAAVAEPGRFGRPVVMLPEALSTNLDRWMDGYRVEGFPFEGRRSPEGEPTLPTFRIYAAGIDDVAPALDMLVGLGLRVRANLEEIEETRALMRTLDYMFLVIAGVAGAGYVAALAATLWGATARKRRVLATLRLVGLARPAAAVFPMVQAAAIACVGAPLAIGVAAWSAMRLNAGHGLGFAEGMPICLIAPADVILAVFITVGAALLASVAAAIRATALDPAEGLRDG